MKKLYIAGSLRNPAIPKVAQAIRSNVNIEVFDDWFAVGPDADDHWRDYEKAKGSNFIQALGGHSATHVFEFDKRNLDDSDGLLLVLPAGKSAHLELGFMRGQNKWTGILLESADPERWDVMYQFVDHIFPSLEEAIEELKFERASSLL
jgi:hypothetical protein